MSLAELKALVRPTTAEPIDDQTWDSAAEELGVTFPEDYRKFLETYGKGLFADFYVVFSPVSQDRAQLKTLIDRVSAAFEDEADLPHPLFPETGGLLPWATDENGNNYFWLTEGPPESWPVVHYEPRGPQGIAFVNHHCGLTDFFLGIFRGEIPALAEGYPSKRMRCPIECCVGWVEGTHDTEWECEECSYEWEGTEIDEAIEEIVSKFPHRAACYQKANGSWGPAPIENEPDDYDELVESESD